MDRPRPLPHGAAVLAGAGMVAWGNGLVLVSRAAGSDGELVTLVGQVAFAAGAVGAARYAAGLSAEELGLRLPRGGGRATPLLVVAAGSVAAAAVAAVLRRGDCESLVAVPRILIATALGEELLFRGVLPALWGRTTASEGASTAANVAFFTLWHVAGAFDDGVLQPFKLIGPAAGGLLFLWARRRFRSVLAPAVLHATTNLPGWVLKHCW